MTAVEWMYGSIGRITLERILIYQVEQGANFKVSRVCDRHLDTDAQRPDQPLHSNLRKNRTFRLALRRSG